MTIPLETLTLARTSLGVEEVAVDDEAFTVREWADALELSVERTRLLLQQGVFDGIFEKKDVLRTMQVGEQSGLYTYIERDCYKYISQD